MIRTKIIAVSMLILSGCFMGLPTICRGDNHVLVSCPELQSAQTSGTNVTVMGSVSGSLGSKVTLYVYEMNAQGDPVGDPLSSTSGNLDSVRDFSIDVTLPITPSGTTMKFLIVPILQSSDGTAVTPSDSDSLEGEVYSS